MSEEAGAPVEIDRQWLTYVHSALLAWFERNQRDFPWRRSRSPYNILVAEKLLQQTAARESVVEAYDAILLAYPTPAALAQADSSVLASIVHPLGLHYRAEELKILALALHERFLGEVPAELEQLKSLPGVGDYTARAVQSFAFGLDVAVVDTNIARFLHRIFDLPGPIPANPARNRHLLGIAASMAPERQSREYNFALLDLCSLVCTPKHPACEVCPLRPYCACGMLYRKDGDPATRHDVDA